MTEKKIVQAVPLTSMIAAIYGRQVEKDYGMTWDEFSAYLDAHDGELPPIPDGPFAGVAGCWPHLHCDHG